MQSKDLLKFEDFATAVRATAAINRWPKIGGENDVVSYSVYLNGPLAEKLPKKLQSEDHDGATLHATTKNLWLDPTSPRDNLKIAELLSIRSAWMSAVLETSQSRDIDGSIIPLPQEIYDDFAILAEGITSHPWILEQVKQQQTMSLGLRPAIELAEAVLGKPIQDRTPDEITVGKILSQNNEFTVQASNAGEVVTHENRRLNNLPVVGQDVMVSYYRGQGQVLLHRQELTVSDPYIDANTQDLAINLIAADGSIKETILFNSISSIAKFQEAEGLDKSIVVKAMDAKEALDRISEPYIVPERKATSDVYIDDTSGCLAVDYVENGSEYVMLLGSADSMVEIVKDYGMTDDHIKQAYKLQGERSQTMDLKGQRSLLDARIIAEEAKLKSITPNLEKSAHVGTVVAETTHHVVQNIGQRTVAIHDKRVLDKVPSIGEKMVVKYDSYRARVDIPERSQARGVER